MTDRVDTPEDLEEALREIGLLVERRNFERAQRLGQELLLRFPNSAEVHEALGDVAEGRQLYREAIEWYELALRLGPDPVVLGKLEQAREALAMEQETPEEPATPPPLPRDNRAAMVVAVAGGFIVIAVLVALIASVLMREKPRPRPSGTVNIGRPAGLPGEPTGPARPAPAPEIARPATRPGFPPYPRPGPVVTTRPAQAPAPAHPGPRNLLRVTESVSGPMSDTDQLLSRALGAITWPNGDQLGTNVEAWVDPFTGYAMISLQVPTGMKRTDLFNMTIDMAYKLAVGAIHAEPGVNSVTVRVLVQIETENDRNTTVVAFRGNTNRETLDYYLKRNIQPDRDTLWKHVFATTWWNPSVPSS